MSNDAPTEDLAPVRRHVRIQPFFLFVVEGEFRSEGEGPVRSIIAVVTERGGMQGDSLNIVGHAVSAWIFDLLTHDQTFVVDEEPVAMRLVRVIKAQAYHLAGPIDEFPLARTMRLARRGE